MARTIYLRASAVVAGALAALVVLAALGDTPAEAKKRKSGGLIVFNSNRDDFGNNSGNDMEIWSINPDGTGLAQLSDNTVLDDGAVISPDGTKLAYSGRENRGGLNNEGDREIWVMDLTADFPWVTRTQLTFDNMDDSTPDWSPDGTKIAFSRFPVNSPVNSEIWVMTADGSNLQNWTKCPGVGNFRPVFSPDGSRIAFTSLGYPDTNDLEIFDMSALSPSLTTCSPGASPNWRNLTNNTVSDFRPDYSPDGKKIVYDSAGVDGFNPEGEFEVMRMNADGTNKKNLTRNDTDDLRASFSPSSKIVYENLAPFASNESGFSPNTACLSNPNIPCHNNELWTMKADGSRKRNLTKTDSPSINQLPDWGKALTTR